MASVSTRPRSTRSARPTPRRPDVMTDLTAIDILIDPEATMVTRAVEVNQRMLRSVPPPTGFALDEHHQPHITLLQRYVRTDALEEVYAAVQGALDAVDVSTLSFTAVS